MPTELPPHHRGAMHYDGVAGARAGQEKAAAGVVEGEYYPNIGHRDYQLPPGHQLSNQQRQQQQQLLYDLGDHCRQQQQVPQHPTAQQTTASFIANLMTTAGARDEPNAGTAGGTAGMAASSSPHRYEQYPPPGLQASPPQQPLLHHQTPQFAGGVHHHPPGAHPPSYYQQHQRQQQLEYQHQQQLDQRGGVPPQHERHGGGGGGASAGHGRDIYHRGRLEVVDGVGRLGGGGGGDVAAAASSAFAPVAPAPPQHQRPHPAVAEQHQIARGQTTIVGEGTTIPMTSALDLLALSAGAAATTATTGRSPPGIFQRPSPPGPGGGAPTPPSLPLNPPPSASPPFTSAAAGTTTGGKPGASPTLTMAAGQAGILPHPAQSPSPLLYAQQAQQAQQAQHQRPYVAAASLGGEHPSQHPAPSPLQQPQRPPWDDVVGYNSVQQRRSVVPSPRSQQHPPQPMQPPGLTAPSPTPGATTATATMTATTSLLSEEELAVGAHRDYVELQRRQLDRGDDHPAVPVPVPAPASVVPEPIIPSPSPAPASTPTATASTTQEGGVAKKRRRSATSTTGNKVKTKKIRPVEVRMDVDDGSGSGPQRKIRVFQNFMQVEKNLTGVSRWMVSKVCNRGGGTINGMHFQFFVEDDDQTRRSAESDGGATAVDKGTRPSPQHQIQQQKRRHPDSNKGAAPATTGDKGNEALSQAGGGTIQMTDASSNLGHHEESTRGADAARARAHDSHADGTTASASTTAVEAPDATAGAETAAGSGGKRDGEETKGEESSSGGGAIAAGTGSSKSSNATADAAAHGGETMPDAGAADDDDDGGRGEEKMSTVNLIRDQMFQYKWPSPSVEVYKVFSELVSICRPPGHSTAEAKTASVARGNEHGIAERFLSLVFGVCDDGVPLAAEAGNCDGIDGAIFTDTDKIALSGRKSPLVSTSSSEYEQEKDMWWQTVNNNPELLRPSRATRNLAPRILVLFYDRISEAKPRPKLTQLLGIAYVVLDSSPLTTANEEGLDPNEPRIRVYPLHAIHSHSWEKLSRDFGADTCDGDDVVTGDCKEQMPAVTVDRDAAYPLSREGENSLPNGEGCQEWACLADPKIALGGEVFGSLGSWIKALLGGGHVYSDRVNEHSNEPGVGDGSKQSLSPWWLRHLLVRVVPGMYRLSMPIGPTAATKLAPLVNNVDVTVQPSNDVPAKEGPVESFPNDSSAHAIPNSDTRAIEMASFDVMSVPVPSPRAPPNCRILSYEQASILRWKPTVPFSDKGAQSPFFREEKSDQDQGGRTAASSTSTLSTKVAEHFFQIGLLPLKFFYELSEVNNAYVVVPVPTFVNKLMLLLSAITEGKSDFAGTEQQPGEDPPHEEQDIQVSAKTVATKGGNGSVMESTVSSKDDSNDARQQDGTPALRKNGQDRNTIMDLSGDNASLGDKKHIVDHVHVESEACPEEGCDDAIALRRRETESEQDAKQNFDRDEVLLCDGQDENEGVAGGTAEIMDPHQHVIDSVTPEQRKSANIPLSPDNRSDGLVTATCKKGTPDDAVPVDATKSRMTASAADLRDMPTEASQPIDDQSTSTVDEGINKSSLSAVARKTLYHFRDILLDVENAYAHIDKCHWDVVRQFDDIESYENAPLSSIWTARSKKGESREDVAAGGVPMKPKASCASEIDATQTATQKNCMSCLVNGGGTAIFTPVSKRCFKEKTNGDSGDRQLERNKYSLSHHPLDCGGVVLGRHLVWDEGYYSDTEKACLVRDVQPFQATTDQSSVHDNRVVFLTHEGNVVGHGDDTRDGEKDSGMLPKVSRYEFLSSSSTVSKTSQQQTVDVCDRDIEQTSSSNSSRAAAKDAIAVLNRRGTKNGTLSAKAPTPGSTPRSVAPSTDMKPATASNSDTGASSALAGGIGMATRTSSGKAYKNSFRMSQVINELASGKLDPHALVECEPYKLGPELRFARSVSASTAADYTSIAMTGRFHDADKAESHPLGEKKCLRITHRENGCKKSWQTASQTKDSLPVRYRKQVSDDAELLSLVVETLDPARTENTSKGLQANGPLAVHQELFVRLQNNIESIQPFAIRVSPDASFLIDLHVHLVTCEVIGFLGGKWVPEEQCIYIQAAFPCKATDRCDSGETDVEMDPVSQVVVKEAIAKQGLMVCGWYHSHPKFRPDPSVTDIDNQANYQRLMQNDNTSLNCSHDLGDQKQKEDSGLEVEDEDSNASMQVPFVGLIVGTYGGRNPTPYSVWNWFHVTPKTTSSLLAPSGRPLLSRRSGSISSAAVVNFPRKLDATTRVFRRHVNLPMCNGTSDKSIRNSMTQNGTHSRELANLRNLIAWKRARQGKAETPRSYEDCTRHIATATPGRCSSRAQTGKQNDERNVVEKTHRPHDGEGASDASKKRHEGRYTNGQTRAGPEGSSVVWCSNRSQDPVDETNSEQQPNNADQSRNGTEYGILANVSSASAKGLVLVPTAQAEIESAFDPKTKDDPHQAKSKCAGDVQKDEENKQADPRISSGRCSNNFGASIVSLSEVIRARQSKCSAKLRTGAKNKLYDSPTRSSAKENGKKAKRREGSEENMSKERKSRGSNNSIAHPLPFSRIELDRLKALDKLRYCQPDGTGREEVRDGSARSSNPTDAYSSGFDAEMEIAEIVWNAIEREQWMGTKGSKPRDSVAEHEDVVVDSTLPSQNSNSMESQEESVDRLWIRPCSAQAIRNRLLLKCCRGTLNRFQSPEHRKARSQAQNHEKRDTGEDVDKESFGRVDDATIVHGIDVILHYYASNPKRVNMNDPWNGGGRKMSKGAKVFTSILRWAKLMHVGSNSGRGPDDKVVSVTAVSNYSDKLQIPWDGDVTVGSSFCSRNRPSPDIDLASEAMRLLAAYWRETSGRPKAGKRRRRTRK